MDGGPHCLHAGFVWSGQPALMLARNCSEHVSYVLQAGLQGCVLHIDVHKGPGQDACGYKHMY